jgi:phosphate transport system protein
MIRHLHAEVERLKKKILSLGAMVEERVAMAIKAIETNDAELSKKLIAADREIDETEVEVEEECLKIIALHQPVAVDLRFISAVIKINNDLERIADEAVNIAERVENISKSPPVSATFDFPTMAERAQNMLKNSLDALVNLDVDQAYQVTLADDEVDDMNQEICAQVKNAICEQADHADSLINSLLISRHLERIADHATNIAEEVIYLIEGIIPRHPSVRDVKLRGC